MQEKKYSSTRLEKLNFKISLKPIPKAETFCSKFFCIRPKVVTRNALYTVEYSENISVKTIVKENKSLHPSKYRKLKIFIIE